MSEPEDRRTERLKLFFEILKHQATLDTAAALVILAIGRDVGAPTLSFVLPLVLFGTSIVLCLFGMVSVAGHVGDGTDSAWPLKVLAVASGMFISGLLLFALFAVVL